MRILLSCLQSLKRHRIASYQHWRLYFTKGCEEAGIEFIEVPDIDWAEGLTHPPGDELNRWRTRTWEAVLSYVRSERASQPIDFFLGYLYPQQIEVAAIAELQRLGIPSVNFFCDNVREFRKVPGEYHPFALHWVPEFEALPMYSKARLPHLHAPMPCWIPPELRTVPVEETEPATFIGSPDVLRRDLLGRALNSGAEFVIRGYGWKDGANESAVSERSLRDVMINQMKLIQSQGLRGLLCKVENRLLPVRPPEINSSKLYLPVSREDYLRITREAQVTIGVNRVPTAWRPNRNPLAYSRLRDLEAPMLGACYLAEWTEGLEHLYELGNEIETYHSAGELCAKLKILKNDLQRRQNLRQKAQQRALAKHSVSETLKRIGRRIVG
jgi:hypothetical protein